jgi:hypothetical protein
MVLRTVSRPKKSNKILKFFTAYRFIFKNSLKGFQGSGYFRPILMRQNYRNLSVGLQVGNKRKGPRDRGVEGPRVKDGGVEGSRV